MATFSLPIAYFRRNYWVTLSSSWGPINPDIYIDGSNFVAGHRYFFMSSVNFTGDAVFFGMQFNGVFINGTYTVHWDNPNGLQVFNCGSFIGTGGGHGLQALGACVGSNPNYSMFDFWIMAIDLDANPGSFPNSSDGWLWFETGDAPLTIPTANYGVQSSFPFTSDGVSDYLVIASGQLDNSLNAGPRTSLILSVDGDESAAAPRAVTRSAVIASGFGESESHILSTVMHAPSAGAHTLSLRARGIDGISGWSRLNYGRYFVLRLNAFTNYTYTYTPDLYTPPDTSGHTIQVSGLASPPPARYENWFVFFRTELVNWVSNQGARLNLYEDVRSTDPIMNPYVRVDGYEMSGYGDVNYPAAFLFPDQSRGYTTSPNTWSLDATSDAAAHPSHQHRLLVAFKNEITLIPYVDTAAIGLIQVVGSAAPGILAAAAATGSIEVVGLAIVERLISSAALALIQVAGEAEVERLTSSHADGPIHITGLAVGLVASGRPLPSIVRSFSDIGSIRPDEKPDVVLSGNDDPGVKNRLVVTGITQLGIDPAYTGAEYTFQGPANPLSDPIKLGFNVGDKIHLVQASGQPAGPNNNKTFTIINPATLEVFEPLAQPDSIAYKFYAIKRGH